MEKYFKAEHSLLTCSARTFSNCAEYWEQAKNMNIMITTLGIYVDRKHLFSKANTYSQKLTACTFFKNMAASLYSAPVMIRVRIGPQHSLVCRRISCRPDGTIKTKVLCHKLCCTIKILPRSEALRADHRHKFCCPSIASVTSRE
jgi:hypothetical protein